MKKFFHLLIFSSVLAMSACSGDDGAVGPQGEPGENGAPGEQGDQGNQGDPGEQGIPGDYSSKMGFFEGTITGTRKDGTAFTEPFKYEFAYGSDMYDGNILDLNRFQTLNGAVAYGLTGLASNVDKGYALLSTFTGNEEWEPFDFQFGLVKELSPTTLFVLQVRPYTQEVSYDRVIELSPDMNALYNFPTTTPGTLNYFEVDTDRDDVVDAWSFQVNASDNFAHYSMATGELLHIETPEGAQTSGELFEKYNDIKFVWEEMVEQNVFVKTADNSPVWEYVETVPADPITITNYTEVDGVVSFDFHITISKYRGYLTERGPMGGYLQNGMNSTRHEVTITGKFNSGGKVYESAVGRKG